MKIGVVIAESNVRKVKKVLLGLAYQKAFLNFYFSAPGALHSFSSPPKFLGGKEKDPKRSLGRERTVIWLLV